MELVENHHGNAFQPRIVLQSADQDPFRHDFDPGSCAHALFEAHPVTDCLPDGFPQHPGHPLCNLPRRDTPGLQHDDLPVRKGVQDCQRQSRRLAGPGRGGHDDASPFRQGTDHVRTDRHHRKVVAHKPLNYRKLNKPAR